MAEKSLRYGMRGILLAGLAGFPFVAHAQRIIGTGFSVWHTWMQIIAFFLAIVVLAAVIIWLYRSYKKRNETLERRERLREEEREAAAMRGILCAARHELDFFYGTYKKRFEKLQEQGAYPENMAPAEYGRYVVYPVFASYIGRIREAGLAVQVLSAYTAQMRFIETIQWHHHQLHQQKSPEAGLNAHATEIAAAFDAMELATRTVLEYIHEDGSINPRVKHKLHSQYAFLNTPQSVRHR